MNLTRYLGALLVLVALQFAPGIGAGEAQAACVPTGSQQSADCDTRAEAYAWASSKLTTVNNICAGTNPTNRYVHGPHVSGSRSYYDQGYTCPSGSSSHYTAGSGSYVTAQECPAGTTWEESSKSCFSSAQCLARNSELGSLSGEPRPSLTQSRCVAGCEFKMDTSGPDYTVADWGGQKLYRGGNVLYRQLLHGVANDARGHRGSPEGNAAAGVPHGQRAERLREAERRSLL